MSDRTITIHAFCSVKGGVGKSALAVACAKLLAARGRTPALLDCALTGTSLADGLRLCAPQLPVLEGGAIDRLAEPTGLFFSVDESRELRAIRERRGSPDRPLPPPYLNDLLNEDQEVLVEAFCWRHEKDDGVRYLPSSSIGADMLRSLRWFYTEEPLDWAQRLMWTLDELARQVPTLSDVVIDLPPGTWGFTHETSTILSALMREQVIPEGYPAWHAGSTRWKANAMFVTSSDRDDLLPSLEYLGHNLGELPDLQLLVNRESQGVGWVREQGRRLLGPALNGMGLEQRLIPIPELPELRAVFKDGDILLSEPVHRLAPALRLEERDERGGC